MEFLSYPSKHIPLILLILSFEIGILALPLYPLEFLAYSSKCWNSGPIFINIWILTFSFKHWNSHLISFGCKQYWNSGPKHWNFGSYPSNHWIFYDYNPSTANIVILVLSLYTLEFLSYHSKHWNTYLILSLQTWKFWPHPSKHWNSRPVFINLVVIIFSFQTLEFWPYFYTFWLSDLIFQNTEILFL